MDTTVDLSWPEVTNTEFVQCLAGIDWQRKRWANAIVYTEKLTGRQIAFILEDGRQFIHPGLKE